MSHKKLFIGVMVFGLTAKYLQEAHGVDFYIIKNPSPTELSLGWIAGIGGLIGCGFLFLRAFGFFDEKPEKETYSEEDEEIYKQEVRITQWDEDDEVTTFYKVPSYEEPSNYVYKKPSYED